MFPLGLRRRISKNTAISGQFGFVFKKTLSGRSRDHHDVIVFEKLRFQNVFRPNETKQAAF